MTSHRLRLVAAAAAALLGTVSFGAALPAMADTVSTLTITASPSPISTVDLTKPHAVDIRVECATTIGNLTVIMTDPHGGQSTLQPGVPVVGTVKGFDVSVTPAVHGDYVFSASSTGCGDAAPATVTATGPDIVTNVTTAPSQLSGADFAATGVSFAGTGFHASVTLDVTSTVPGFTPTTVTTDSGGDFTFTQTGSAGTANGYYSTSFTGRQDGLSLGTYLIGVAPPTTSDPTLTLSTHSLTLSQYLATGVTASASGYAPGDLVLAQESAPSGTTYFRGNGSPDSSGDFVATISGTANSTSDRLGIHTVTFSSFLGPNVSDTFDVVADPVASVTATPDPVQQGDPIHITATNLVPNASYVVLFDTALAGGSPQFISTDALGAATLDDTVPADYPLGAHTATLYVLSPATGLPAHLSFNVIAPVPAITVTPSTVHQGESITVSGVKLLPSTQYLLQFNTAIGDSAPVVTTNGAGAFSTSVDIPTDYAIGDHTVSVTPALLTYARALQADADEVPIATFTVLSAVVVDPGSPAVTAPAPSTTTPTTTSSSALASTGADAAPALGAALGLLALGIALFVTHRRRRLSI